MKKEIDDTIVKNIRSFFRLKKENKAIENRIIRDITDIIEKEDYYKPVKIGNFWSKNYIL